MHQRVTELIIEWELRTKLIMWTKASQENHMHRSPKFNIFLKFSYLHKLCWWFVFVLTVSVILLLNTICTLKRKCLLRHNFQRWVRRHVRIHRIQINIHIFMVYNTKYYRFIHEKTFISKTKLSFMIKQPTVSSQIQA